MQFPRCHRLKLLFDYGSSQRVSSQRLYDAVGNAKYQSGLPEFSGATWEPIGFPPELVEKWLEKMGL